MKKKKKVIEIIIKFSPICTKGVKGKKVKIVKKEMQYQALSDLSFYIL